MWDFRTLIVPQAHVALAQSIAVALSPTGGQNMWITPLSKTGSNPATHWVSTGYISPEFAALVPEQVWSQDKNGVWTLVSSTPGDPVLCYQMATQNGVVTTQAAVNALYAASDVTQQDPFVAEARLALKMIPAAL